MKFVGKTHRSHTVYTASLVHHAFLMYPYRKVKIGALPSLLFIFLQ